jgi:hypothetical protein
MNEVQVEANRRKVELFIVPTEQAIELLKPEPSRHQCHLARYLPSHVEQDRRFLGWEEVLAVVDFRSRNGNRFHIRATRKVPVAP